MKPSQAGSSLLEVMVSVTLSSIAALALGLSTTTGYRLVHANERKALANQAALNMIEELRLADPKSMPFYLPSKEASFGPFHFYIQTRLKSSSARNDWWIVDVDVYSSTGGDTPVYGEAPITTLRTSMIQWNKR